MNSGEKDRQNGGSSAAGAEALPEQGSELKRRVGTAALVLPVLLVAVVLGGIPFLVLVAAVAAVGIGEFNGIMEARGFSPLRKVTPLLGIGLAVGAYLADDYCLVVLVTFSILAVFILQLFRKDTARAIAGVSVSLTGVLYVGWLLSYVVLVRNLDSALVPEYPGAAAVLGRSGWSGDLGFFFTIMVFAGVFLGDSGAYFVGRKWGRHKMAPAVSPKKTWEGFFGGLLTACLSAGLVNLLFGARLGFGHALAVGGVVGIFSVLGDLVESQIKRDAGIKDSGSLFPGHGGMLDRLDSILFSFPAAYYYVKIIFALNLV